MAEFMHQSLPPTAELPQKLEVDKENQPDSPANGGQYINTTSTDSGDNRSRQANGRSFHGFEQDAYFLPNDPLEAGRLDLQHYTWKLMMNGHLSLISMTDRKIKTVLDVGTGTGIWCMEVAKAHPDVQVIGTDLSAIQPTSKPPNCHFVQANAEHEWAFDTQFDFIHSRMLTVGMHDWPRYFQNCWNNLSPGGWIQTGETQFPPKRADGEDQTSSSSSPMIRWGQHCYDAAAKAGINIRASENFDEMLAAQGFINIKSYAVQWPVGAWAKGKKNKALGRLTYENMTKAIPGLSSGLFHTQLGWRKEEVDACNGEVMEDMKTGHYYLPMVCHMAQKPYEA